MKLFAFDGCALRRGVPGRSGFTCGRGLRMGGSRIAWAGSAVAPWGIALGLLVSITARADPDPGPSGSTFERNGVIDRPSPVRALLAAAAFAAVEAPKTPRPADPPLIPAHLTLGTRDDLNSIPDEIEPNSAFKRAKAEI